ncbi:MerR family transcriptional regulator [Thermosulfurimonas sp. F29]|uniref:MerR family transcriptional regulator n=1 Tax=Thermosulfurimonas sp. F29 TaxID=2867247 RepID=UPI001C83993E|nr:MerR family transcriptional regulator [Thermosulfurimonas sp. F29]MBX6423562.1 MerR family transcriptional regulator [Thermosulfurimonas sp. F29]
MRKNDPERYYTIREAAELLGLEPHVIRYWEKEFPQLKPRRVAGRRFYGPEELALLRRIKHLLYEEGYTIAGARKALSGSSSRELSAEKVLSEIRRELETLYRMLS